MESQEKILIVDDDADLCTLLSEELNEIGYNADFVTSADDAIDYVINNQSPAVILLDLKMPGKDGFDVMQRVKKMESPPKIIVLTAYADIKSAMASTKLGAVDFVSKPYDLDELLISIRKVLNK